MTASPAVGHHRPLPSALLAWFFVSVWGSGYIATKAGLQYAPPFTFLALRFAFGVAVLVPLLAWWQRRDPLRWPRDSRELAHLVAAGLLMHVGNLGGSHYAQYLGMSAGVTALVLAVQPLATAAIAALFLHERLQRVHWVGVFIGLAGVALFAGNHRGNALPAHRLRHRGSARVFLRAVHGFVRGSGAARHWR
jgi:drug/metabolite transporter (DMT)-like permease